jgi:hypothetical protein
MALSESALVVLVPEAEPLVKPFRDQYDPSAAAGTRRCSKTFAASSDDLRRFDSDRLIGG